MKRPNISSPRALHAAMAGMSELITSGLEIGEAIDLVEIGETNRAHQKKLRLLKKRYQNGMTLGNAFNSVFGLPHLMANHLDEAKEETLPQILQHIAEVIEIQVTDMRKFKMVLMYPLTCLFICMLLIVVIILFVIPVFQEMFSQMGSRLPTLTLIILLFAELLSSYQFVFGILGTAVVWNLVLNRIHILNRLVFSVTRKLPFIGKYLQSRDALLFYTTLLYCLEIDKKIDADSILLASSLTSSRYLKKELHKLSEQISSGKKSFEDIKWKRIYGKQIQRVFDLCDCSDKLLFTLKALRRNVLAFAEYRQKALVTTLEISAMVVVGLIIGTCVIAMYLPIFSMSGSI